MQPGSLIFLVIVAVWAVYLVQHWIRRREHVATARSVDRFSEAMRVLERRAPMPLATPHPHSYAVRPPASRPALVVKRAPAAAAPVPMRSASGRSGRSGRGLRGLALVATLLALPVTVVLSAVGVLLWISVAIAAACLAVVLVGLVSVARRDRVRRGSVGRRSAQRPSARPASRRAAAPASRPVAAAAVEGVEQVERVELDVVTPMDGGLADETERAAAAEAVEPAAEARVYDLVEVDAELAAARAAFLPSTEPWSPVPVPPPTYTLKDSAPRPLPEPAEQVPVPIEVEDDELERLMAARVRRIG